jgi:hypothetical protein
MTESLSSLFQMLLQNVSYSLFFQAIEMPRNISGKKKGIENDALM